MKAARGYWGGRSRSFRPAKETLVRAWRFATIHRRLRKRDFRRLWILRINAAARMRAIKYSRFIHGLKRANVGLNRKILADLAITDPGAFDQLVEVAQNALA